MTDGHTDAITGGSWALIEDTTLTYRPEPGLELHRPMRVWEQEGGLQIAVVTESRCDSVTVAQAPRAAFAALRERYGPDIHLIEHYTPAVTEYGFATPYSWLVNDGAGGTHAIPFDTDRLHRALPGLAAEDHS